DEFHFVRRGVGQERDGLRRELDGLARICFFHDGRRELDVRSLQELPNVADRYGHVQPLDADADDPADDDPNHFAGAIHDRSAGIPGIERVVELDTVQRALVVATQGRDTADVHADLRVSALDELRAQWETEGDYFRQFVLHVGTQFQDWQL